jgi:hypothetical protein
MRTDDLIAAMAADARSASEPIGRTMLIAVAGGAAAAALVFFLALGVRPDFAAALDAPRFLFKCILTLTLFATSLGLVLHLARPGAVPSGWMLALAAAPALLLLGIIAELLYLPPDLWAQRLIGHNALVCMVLIPSLSALPLIAIIMALRQGAPTHPVLAGAAAGLVASGIGASLYATHCQDDSPLFVATWYVIAISGVTLIGAFLGARFLRW